MNTLQGIPVAGLRADERRALEDALRAWRWVCVRRYGVHIVAGSAKRHFDIAGEP